MKRSFKSNWLVIAILAAHFALGAFYSVAVPIWEAYDEWGHHEFIRYIAREHHLPEKPIISRTDETHQPPLYYILCGLATSWIDTSDNLRPTPNPHAEGITGRGGANLALHSKEAEALPYHGTVLAIHVARLFSVLLSTIAVWATYLIGRTLFPRRKEIALGAMAVNAFWPQFLYNGSVVTNDIMVTTCSSLFLLFLIRTIANRSSVLDMFGLGICLGGGLLSKRNGLALLPLALLGLAVVIIKEVKRKRISPALLGGIICFLGGAVLISAWWYRGLLSRYHGHVRIITSLLSHPFNLKGLHWEVLPNALRYTFVTFWASFGCGNVGVEPWVYKLVAVVYSLAILGLMPLLIKSSDHLTKFGIAILLLDLLVALSAPTYQVLRGGRGIGLHGRFVLPAISAVSLLLSIGLASLVPKRFTKMLAASLGLAMFAYAFLIPFRYILPVYATPKLLSSADVEDLEHPLDFNFGDRIELIGYELDSEEVTSGGEVSVTLYWRCLGEMERNYTLAVKVLGRDYRVYGVLHLHPGRGNFPTSLWKKGDIFRETYQVPIPPDAPTPSLAQIGVDFFVYGSDEDLDAFNADGKPSDGTFSRLVIRSREQPEIENPVYYELDGKVALVGYDLERVLSWEESGVRVKLYWQALSEMERDYTVFIHLIGEDGRIKAQGDSQPMGGNSPTSIWKAGEVIKDEHFMPLSPYEEGEYQIEVGMYLLEAGERLPIIEEGEIVGDRILLGKVRVASD